jgi:hypothetical protein
MKIQTNINLLSLHGVVEMFCIQTINHPVLCVLAAHVRLHPIFGINSASL